MNPSRMTGRFSKLWLMFRVKSCMPVEHPGIWFICPSGRIHAYLPLQHSLSVRRQPRDVRLLTLAPFCTAYCEENVSDTGCRGGSPFLKETITKVCTTLGYVDSFVKFSHRVTYLQAKLEVALCCASADMVPHVGRHQTYHSMYK
jgi:hypothetical protein